MNLAASRSAHLKNNLVMRLGCVLVAVGFLTSSVVTPRAQAVAVVDDVAVGAMSCAAFLESIGLPLSATGGAGAVTGGITAVAGEYAAATGAAASGEAVLGSIAAGTAISTAGTIILTAAAVAACAGLAYWIVSEYNFDDLKTDYSIYNQTGYFDMNGQECFNVWIPFGTMLESANGSYIYCRLTSSGAIEYSYYSAYYGTSSAGTVGVSQSDNLVFYPYWKIAFSVSGQFTVYYVEHYADGTSGEPIFTIFPKISKSPYLFFGISSSSQSLEIHQSSDYSIPEIQPNQQMEITIPSAAPGSTLPELVETVPQQVADGTLTATYEIAVDPGAFGETSTPDYEDMEDVDELGLPALGEALTRRFPFSIPWDIARGITLLAAPAKTPHFEVDFYAPISGRVGGWQGDTTLVLDFSEFEVLGRLSRWTSTIGFCLFLASATKRFIWTA